MFLSVLFSLWLLFSSVSYAQTKLNNPACVLELEEQELSPDTPITLVNFNLLNSLKIPLIDLTRLRIKLMRSSDQSFLSDHYLNELKKLKVRFLIQGYTEVFFDETYAFFFHALSQKNETLQQEIETKKLLAQKQKDDLSYPLKGRTPQVVEAIVIELQIPEEDVTIEDLKGITELDLSHKKITELREGDFKGLINLKKLFLFNNQLSELPQNLFQGLGALEVLSVSINQLTGLPQTVFQGLGALEKLYLNNNQLTELPENIFRGLGALEWLFLSNNQLRALPENVFQGLGALEKLYLDCNQLTDLPQTVFQGLGALEWLFLNNNQLTGLPQTVFQGLGVLRFIYLTDNPITVVPESAFSALGLNQNLKIKLNNLSLDKNTKQILRKKYGTRIEGIY